MTNNTTIGYRLADVKRTQLVVQTVGYSTKQKQVARNLLYKPKYVYEVETKIKSMYVAHCRANIYYLFLSYLFFPRTVVVRVKEHDPSSRFWFSES